MRASDDEQGINKLWPYNLRNLQTSRENNLRIRSTKNPNFSGYCFHMNTSI